MIQHQPAVPAWRQDVRVRVRNATTVLSVGVALLTTTFIWALIATYGA